MAVGATLAIFAATMLLDWWLELPLWVRAVFLALNVASVAYVLVWHVIVPVVWSPDDDEVALWVEGWTPALGDRLIAAVQLSRAGALPAGRLRRWWGKRFARQRRSRHRWISPRW
jgi:hypothetical protein